MKQNNFYILIIVVMLAGAALTACTPKSSTPEANATSEPVVLGPQYSKKGLFVPEETRRSLGLRVVEVTEQKIGAMIELPLRVYQVINHTGWASGTVTPEQAKKLRTGQPVELRTAEGRVFAGRVKRWHDELLKATGALEMLVEFSPGPDAVPAGASLQARVTLDVAMSVVSIPRAALLQCSDGFSVFAVNGEHFVRTPVQVGAADADRVEITDGLYPGDQVVVQPVMSLWMTERAAVKGGQACCAEPPKGK